MSWTIAITVASASSGGDVPISNATITWIDGTTHSINNSSYFSASNPAGTVTITVDASSTNFTAACPPSFDSQTLPASASTGSLLFELPSAGGSGTTGSCFIATAAYGSPAAPEVKFLQNFRDNVLRRTRWGHRFFADLWKHYYRISPPIAHEMDRDPELRRVIRWAIVEPWMNYMRLMMARPDFRGMNLDGLDPKLRTFLAALQADSERWLAGIDVPKSFEDLDPRAAVDELNIAVGLVLLQTAGRDYLHDLTRRGELPLQFPKEEQGRLRGVLTEAGRTEEEIALILGGA